MNNPENSEKSVQEWNFPLFELQWFTTVEDRVLLGINNSSKNVFAILPLLFSCLAFLRSPVGQWFLTKMSFKPKDSELLKAFEGHRCLELFLICRILVSNPQSSFSTSICTIPATPQACTSPALSGIEVTPVQELAGRSITNDFLLFPSRQLPFIFAVAASLHLCCSCRG